MKQTISMSFDPSGSHLAYGGMTNEIFIVNLKNCEDLQVNLEQSFLFDKEIVPLRLNLLHKMCVIKNLHTNFIDGINWYSESSLITKSASGDIVLWQIKGIDAQNIPFKNNNCLQLVKQLCIHIDNCNLW
jgi:WD40 repeat protein